MTTRCTTCEAEIIVDCSLVSWDKWIIGPPDTMKKWCPVCRIKQTGSLNIRTLQFFTSKNKLCEACPSQSRCLTAGIEYV